MVYPCTERSAVPSFLMSAMAWSTSASTAVGSRSSVTPFLGAFFFVFGSCGSGCVMGVSQRAACRRGGAAQRTSSSRSRLVADDGSGFDVPASGTGPLPMFSTSIVGSSIG